ncbi:hypothetical protein HYV74_03455 [Candidatus Uhrbacteria bacterium]|nr:hypothetical protein [Candidatus Uhrbacteria bacterium]
MNVPLLIGGAVLSFGVALLHVVIIFFGAPAYRYFGAGEQMVSMAERGSVIPAVLTLGLVGVFVAFGGYALAAAGVVKGLRLPFVHWVVFAIAAIYSLRGLMSVSGLFLLISGFDIVSSLISLGIGVVHFLGLYWNRVRRLLIS